jgi:hypothetical protein
MVEDRFSESGLRSHGKDSRHHVSLWRKRRVADGVDTAMQPMQPASEQARSYRIVTHSRPVCLGHRDHTVLPFGDLGESPIGCGDFSGHFTDKSPHPGFHPLPLGRLGACCGC